MNAFIQKTPMKDLNGQTNYNYLFFHDMNFHSRYAMLRANRTTAYHGLNGLLYAFYNIQICLSLRFIRFFNKMCVSINDVDDFRFVTVSNSNNDVRKRSCLHLRVTAGSEMYKEAGKLTFF